VQTRLVSRTEDPLDRRRTLAQLSPSGEELAEQINQIRSGALRRWLARLDDPTLAAFHQGSQALAAVAQSESSQVSKIT
jgi:DNA-binding MarR family transcriptional regulator